MVRSAPQLRPRPASADVALSRRFARDLASRLGGRLQRAILFGSRARGDPLPGSDWDVLILVDAYDRRVRQAVEDAAERYEPREVDVQFFTPERWRWSLRVGAPLLRHALSEGVTLWPPTRRGWSSPERTSSAPKDG